MTIDDKREDFTVVGIQATSENKPLSRKNLNYRLKKRPIVAIVVLVIMIAGCFFSPLFINHDPTEFYLTHLNQAPNREFYFGTDALGRDIYSVIWSGGRTSLAIGVFSAAIISVLGICYGCLSGLANDALDSVLMRIIEIFQSIPTLLLLLLLSSLVGRENVFSMSLIIGITGWFPLARMVRSEVKLIRNSEYLHTARRMGGGFYYLMTRHLLPNVLSSIMFMMISSISTSMLMESTLSFLGLGLPVDSLSWGSMLVLANRALLLNTWWVIVFPGVFLVVTFLCMTAIGNYCRHYTQKKTAFYGRKSFLFFK